MTKCEVIDKVVNVMVNKLKMNPSCIVEENYNKPLTMSTFGLNPISMTYLFFEIEKNFNIRVMPHDILNGNFNTVNGIAEVIIKYTVREVNL